MADKYIRKQDAIYALDKEYRYGADIDRCGLAKAFKAIESLEPADVVKVVRCKDCKHHAYDEIFSCYWCEYTGMVRETTPDGFCDKGEE